MSDVSSSRDPLEQLAEEFTERYRRGERPPLSEYTARHPELAGAIRELFPTLVEMEQMASVEGPHPGTSKGAADGDTMPRQLGEYRILREIGRGGMGLVYEAVQESLGRHVAVKVLPLHGLLNPTQLERFRREARSAARLHHTNIVPVFGVGEDNGLHYYAMQFIQGHNLDTVLGEVRRLRGRGRTSHPDGASLSHSSQERVAWSLLSGQFAPSEVLGEVRPSEMAAPLDTSESASSLAACSGDSLPFTTQTEAQYYRSVARAGVQVAEALAYAHEQGILHRDIKPSNLLLDLRGTVWITDFGLAKEDEGDDLTHTGDLVGTLRFMAPERFAGRCDVRSEVYAIGATLYEMLTLRPAFGEKDRLALLEQVRRGESPPPSHCDPHVPRDLETIVLKAMARDPAARYSSAAALADDLRRFLADRPIVARRATMLEQGWRWCRRNPWLAGLSAAVLLLLLVVAVGSTAFALRLQHELGRRRLAEHEQTEQLFEAQLAEARARRYSGRSGQRFKSLEALQKAVELARQLKKPAATFDALRDEAIAALCLPDIDDDGPEWKTACPSSSIAFDDAGERYVQVDGLGHAYYCRVVEGREERLKELEVEGTAVSGEWHSRDLRFLALGNPHVDGKGHRWLKLWRCDGPKAKLILEDPVGVSEWATTFRPDGRQLAVGRPDGTLVVYDTETAAIVRGWHVGTAPMSAAFHPRLPRLAVACGAEVCFYDVESGVCLSSRLAHPGQVHSVAWHPDGRQLAVACGATKVFLWDTQTGRQRPVAWGALVNHVIVLQFNSIGDRLLSCDWSGILRLWDPGTGRELFNRPWGGPLARPLFCRGDQYLVARSAGDTIRLRRFAAGREQRVLIQGTPAWEEDDIWPLRHSRGRLMSANLPIEGREGFDGSGALLSRNVHGVFRWPVREEAGRPERLRLGPPERVTNQRTLHQFSRSRDGKVLAFANGTHATLVHLGPPRRTLMLGPQYDVRWVSVSDDGRWVVTGSHWSDGSGEYAKLWEAATGKLVKTLPWQGGVQPHFKPGGRWLSNYSGSDSWYAVDTWEPKAIPCPPGLLAPDERLVASTSGYGEIQLTDFETGRGIARLSIPDLSHLQPTSFSPDGAYLYARGNEKEGASYRFDLRQIRRQLAAMDLDLNLPAYPEPAPRASSWPLSLDVTIDGAELANDAAKLRRHELAQSALALRANPFDAEAHAQLGSVALGDGRWTVAFLHLSVARALRPDDFEIRRRRAWAAFSCGQWQEAVRDADWVLRQQPDHLQALLIRGPALQRLGRHAEAIADFTSQLRFYPSNSKWYEQRARSYEALNDHTRAAADRRKAVELAPHDMRRR